VSEGLRLASLAVHAGRPVAGSDSGVNPPLVLSVTYDAAATRSYGRDGSATWEAFEEAVGALEGGSAVSFASGSAASAAVLAGLPSSARVVMGSTCYHGTRSLAGTLAAKGRFSLALVDATRPDEVAAAVEGASLLWLESPTNPLLELVDLAAASEVAHAAGAVVVVDGTAASPILQRPLAIGADLVVHSATKLLGGHSDLLAGVVVAARPELAAELRAERAASGAVPGALESWLALRGLRTLAVRVERAQASAIELARRLADHPAVTRVWYPGLEGAVGGHLLGRQMDGPGLLVSFELASASAAERFCRSVRLATYATSFGGVETLLERRARWPAESCPAGLVRVSVGLEALEDLWADFAGALAVAD